MLSNIRVNNQGMAAIEIIPILVIVMYLVVFTFGFFGVIHTGILNSIGARNYAFETFRHRSDLSYLRENGTAVLTNYYTKGVRFHTTIAADKMDASTDQKFIATARRIDFLKPSDLLNNSVNYHNSNVRNYPTARRFDPDRIAVNPVWIFSTYGICLTSKCGDP